MPSFPGEWRTISSLGGPEFSLEEFLRFAAAHGIDAVELRVLEGTLDLPAYFRRKFSTPAELGGFVAAQPVRIVSLGTSLKLVGHTERDWAALRKFLPWAEALGGTRLRIFDGGVTMDGAELEAAVAALSRWRAERAAGGWKSDLMIETHDTLVTTAALRRFLAAVHEGTALLWDTHHTWRAGGENPAATWSAVQRHAVHLHVKDSVTLPPVDGKPAHAYVLPGTGDFPMAELRAVLRRGGFAGPVSLEWEKHWHPELPPLATALAHAERSGWW